ncbi:MAG: Hsp70 family protein [Rubrivivax sp.]
MKRPLAIDIGSESIKLGCLSPDDGKHEVLALADADAARYAFRLSPMGEASLLLAGAAGFEAEAALVSGMPKGRMQPLRMRTADGRSASTAQLLEVVFSQLHALTRADLRRFCREGADAAIVAVPLRFGERDREVWHDAARLAGFAEVRLVDEPLAAASHWTAVAGEMPPSGILVVDVGAGSLDWSWVRRQGSGFCVATEVPADSVADLGGRALDRALLELLGRRVPAASGRQLVPALQAAKQILALGHGPAAVMIEGRGVELVAGELREIVRERWIGPVVRTLRPFVGQVLDRCGGEAPPALLLVGGAADTPGLADALSPLGCRLLHAPGGEGWAARHAVVLGSLAGVAPRVQRPAPYHDDEIQPRGNTQESPMKNPEKQKKTPRPTAAAAEPQTIVGIDFGDSETAVAVVGARTTADAPQEVVTTLGNTNTGIIPTVVGRTRDGGVVVGMAAANTPPMQLADLHVGFKTTPVPGDSEYRTLSITFLNALGETLIDKGFVDPQTSSFVFGHPTRWKSIDGGTPVEVYRQLIAESVFGRHRFEVVPESRAAMVEVVESDKLSARLANSGWVLVIDVGSSTTDFTAVDMRNRASSHIDYGDEIGARLIDRAIVNHAIEASESPETMKSLIAANAPLQGSLELFARQAKEAYFSQQRPDLIQRTLMIPVDSKKLFFMIELDQEVMAQITGRIESVTIGGKPMSWSQAFTRTLKEVAAKLHEARMDKLSAIVLTGGASRMGFVTSLCEAVFPAHAGRIAVTAKPSFDIAAGLARWGRVEVRTAAFMKDVEAFAATEIPKVIEKHFPALIEGLAEAFSDYVIGAINTGVSDWKRGSYQSLNRMTAGISASIESGMENDAPRLIEKVANEWMAIIMAELAGQVQPIETRFGMMPGKLGASFAAGSDTLSGTKAGLSNIHGFADDATDVVSGVVGIVSGLVAGILAANLYPAIMLLVYVIVAKISATLAGLLLAILGSTPIGWVLLAGLGITVAIKGKEVATNIIRDADLPGWSRDKLIGEKTMAAIRSKRSEIYGKVHAELAASEELRTGVEAAIVKALTDALVAKADDARLLIK